MNLTTRYGVTAKERDLATKWIKRCLREITRKDHELPADYAGARSDIVVTLKQAGSSIIGLCQGCEYRSNGLPQGFELRNGVSGVCAGPGDWLAQWALS